MKTGELIRDLRNARGWSQGRLAIELNKVAGTRLTREYISRRWESGKVEPSPFWLRHLTTVFGGPLLTGDPEVNRRQLLASLTIAATSTHDALSGRRQSGADALLADIEHGKISEMRARFGRLVELDNHLGGADTYQLYVTELSRTESALQTMSPRTATTRELVGLASQQAQQAGWAAFDAGFNDAAHRLFVYGKQAAREAGDRALEANALVHIAYATNDRDAADIADAACDALGTSAPPKAVALLESRRAWSRARSGDRDGATRALDMARDALQSDTGSDPEPSWYSWIDHNELDIMTGRVWSVLREPKKATPPLVRALERYPVHWARDRALYLSWLADACLDAGDPETAIATADTALSLATTVASARPLIRVREVAQRFVGRGVTGGPGLLARATAARAPIPVAL
ncbi:helix-turn-helix domain-containing protein [Nocardia ignorata]|uniref:helix-turn-helix domain-containing protein n=2 Tax=Actinomycetes TaxID=1760 RepID=UPI0036258D4F